MSDPNNEKNYTQFTKKVTVGCYIALAVAILFFSGLLNNVEGFKWLSALDFATISGHKFHAVMLALGVLEILEHYGAIRAAHKLMTPLLKPILGIPGLTGLAMITDLQSTDAGAAITKDLYDNNLVNRKELTIMTAWQYSGAGMINNYVAIGSAIFAYLTVPIILPLIVVFVMKFFGGAVCRIALNTVFKGDFKDEQQ